MMANTLSDRLTIGRFAPTPSGRMHTGNAFSALMAWLAARHDGGRLVLRIEDLDPRGNDPDASKLLIDDLHWMGLDWDEGPYYQSERLDLYEDAVRRLTDLGLTYPCFCTRSELHAASAPHASDGTYVYTGACRYLSRQAIAAKSRVRPAAVRLRVPDAGEREGIISFVDAIYGPYREVLADDCGDFLVRRSDGVFAYQLAVVVDDHLMGVTQVVRGRDLLGSSARQIYLQGLLGYDHPTYAHIPLLVAPDGRRLSKRDRDLDLKSIRARQHDSRQLVGWLAHAAGFSDEGEWASPQDLVERFSWKTLADKAKSGDIVGYDYAV